MVNQPKKVAKTGAERVRSYRERLKANEENYNVYKAKDKERKKVERHSIPSSNEVARQKILNRERVRRYRQKKKEETIRYDPIQEVSKAYQTPQALGKAICKVRKHLPKSPRKRNAVVFKLASGIPLKKKCTAQGNRGIPEETVKLVRQFFQLDYVSRQAPGRKDFVTVKDNKTKIQKRHLLWSLRETYAMFIKENPVVKIGLSKFCCLRPVNVKLSADMPPNVCLCQYHENIRLLCQCLNKEIPEFPIYSRGFTDHFVCSSESEVCMLGKCPKCPTKWLQEIKKEIDLDTATEWYKWERVEQEIKIKKGKNKKTIKKMKKICKEGTVEEAIKSLENQMPFFLQHVFVKRQQSNFFEDKKTNLTKHEAIIQVDFAENYTCKYQDEIQSAHWNQQQVTLFTVAIWTNNGVKTTCESQVIVTDELGHDKKAVAVFMSNIVDKIVKKRHPQVTRVCIFSDGPSTQFKNKYIAHFLHTLRASVDIQWNYFATSHGKGAVDGIGGTVKRMVWNAVSTRKAITVTDAKSFAHVANTVCKAVGVSYISQEEMECTAHSLSLEKCFTSAPAVTGIKKFHMLEPLDNCLIRCRVYSYQNTWVDKGIELVSDSEESSSDSCSEIFEEHSGESESKVEVDFAEEENQISSEDNVVLSENEEDSSRGYKDDRNEVSNKDEERNKANTSTNDGGDEYEEGSKTPGAFKNCPVSNIEIDEGLPDDLLPLFNSSTTFRLPHFLDCNVTAILDGVIKFEGSAMISREDRKALCGIDVPKYPREKYLSNFVIDEYLSLIKSECEKKGTTTVETLSWETFEKGVGSVSAITFLKGKSSLLHQDAVLIPCNDSQSEHWTLLVVLPKKKLILYLDSLAADIIKPLADKSISKVALLIKELDNSVDISKWKFCVNTKDDVPQQSNSYDCGAFICLYARCLLGLSQMIDGTSFNSFRKLVLVELHERMLKQIPPEGIQVEQYYAVEYVENYYIGRVLSQNGDYVKLKFLHRVGAHSFNWPRRDDVDEVHMCCLFYGPVLIQDYGPFVVPNLQEIEKIFKKMRKER